MTIRTRAELEAFFATTGNREITAVRMSDFLESAPLINEIDGVVGGIGDAEVVDTTLVTYDDVKIEPQLTGRWRIHYTLEITQDGGGEGIKLGLLATNLTITEFKADFTFYNSDGALYYKQRITSVGNVLGVSRPIGTHYVEIEVYFRATVADSTSEFDLQFAQNATGASAGVHITPTGTYARAWRIST